VPDGPLAALWDVDVLLADHSCNLRPAACKPDPVSLAAFAIAAFVALAAPSRLARAVAATPLADISGKVPADSTFCCADCLTESTCCPT
jgi:hypothetical protein